jgi:hypothetical protein
MKISILRIRDNAQKPVWPLRKDVLLHLLLIGQTSRKEIPRSRQEKGWHLFLKRSSQKNKKRRSSFFCCTRDWTQDLTLVRQILCSSTWTMPLALSLFCFLFCYYSPLQSESMKNSCYWNDSQPELTPVELGDPFWPPVKRDGGQCWLNIIWITVRMIINSGKVNTE